MAIIPIYQRNVKQAPSHQKDMSARASADHMGAAVGRGLQGLGQGVGQAAEAIHQAQEEDRTVQAKERHNQYMAEKDRLLYDPTHGYAHKNGNNALLARPEFEENLRSLRKKYSEGLQGSALKRFDQAAAVTERDGLRAGMIHAGRQKAAHASAVHAERMDSFGNQIANAYGDEELQEKYTNAGLAEIREQAAVEGWSEEQIAMRSDLFRSNARRSVVASIAMQDPHGALAYYEKYKSDFTAKDRIAVEEVLNPIIQEADDNALIEQSMRNISVGDEVIYGDDGIGDYLNRMVLAESGGDPNAQSATSSASGLAQFTEGTWDYMRKAHPELGLTKNGRADPTQAMKAARQFTINNARALSSAGIPISKTNLYAAHFLGLGGKKSAGAIQVLSADDSQMMRDIVSPAKIKANPFLRSMSVHQFKMWSARKMGIAPNIHPRKVSVIYDLAGKTRDKPVQDHVVSQMTTAAAATDPRISIRVTSGGQDPFGTGYKRTGSTRHDHGNAADIVLQIDGKDVLPHQNPQLYERFLENAAAAGMTGIGHYSWGVHVGGGKRAAWGADKTGKSLDPRFGEAIKRGWRRAASGGGPVRGFAPVGNAAAIELAIQNAKTPAQRARLQKRLNAEIARAERMKKARSRQAKEQGLDHVLRGNPPSSLPHSVKLLMGEDGLKGLHSLHEQQVYQGDVTDPETYARLLRMSAENPEEFAAQELYSEEYLSKLSQSDFKSLVKAQTDITKSALATQTEAAQKNSAAIATGKVYKEAYQQADVALEAVGITTSGYSKEDRQEKAKRIAEFQIALKAEIDQYINKSEGQTPAYNDVQTMINRLMVPIVIKDKDEWWPADGYLDGWSPDDGKRLFDARLRPDGSNIDIVVEYADIPAEIREAISRDLALQKGSKPTPDEIVEFYETAFLAR